jgi:hypothetical protein
MKRMGSLMASPTEHLPPGNAWSLELNELVTAGVNPA